MCAHVYTQAHEGGWALDHLHSPGSPGFPEPGDSHLSLLSARPHCDLGQVIHPLWASVYLMSRGYYFLPPLRMEFLENSGNMTNSQLL